MNEQNKTCLNCKYFSQYYVLGVTMRFSPTRKGFCSNAQVKDVVCKQCLKKNTECDLWQPRELQKLKEQYCVELKLQLISEQLDDVIALLRDVE